jgi:hypothetical protein
VGFWLPIGDRSGESWKMLKKRNERVKHWRKCLVVYCAICGMKDSAGNMLQESRKQKRMALQDIQLKSDKTHTHAERV